MFNRQTMNPQKLKEKPEFVCRSAFHIEFRLVVLRYLFPLTHFTQSMSVTQLIFRITNVC